MTSKKGFTIDFSKIFYSVFGIFVVTTLISNPVLAQDLSDISENMISNTDTLPRLITGIGYLIGIGFGVHGIIKLKDHVESPNQTALRYPLISLAIGGAMFALPIIYEAMVTLINDGDPIDDFGGGSEFLTLISGAAGSVLGALPLQVFGTILSNIIESIEEVPRLITGAAYLLGVLFGVTGLLKLKEHVEEPSRVQLKDAVVRLVIGGMLFAIPTVYESMMNLISQDGDGGIINAVAGVSMVATSAGLTSEAVGFGCGGNAVGAVASTIAGTGGFGLGNAICNIFLSTTPFVAFLTAVAYLFGLVVGIWAILKIKEHVENPAQVSIWDPVAKFVVAGGFFALPYVVSTAYNTVATLIVPHSNALNGEVRLAEGPFGLDGMIAALVNSTFMPMTVLINWFALVAGVIFVFIGISRLMKSAQEGARGPGGIGTIMTFITGGALLAFSPVITSLGTSMFVTDGINTPNEGTLRYTSGLSDPAIARIESVLDSVILFVMLVGFVSVARGIFIMRGVAEGNSQASSMAGITHLVGGALAVNLAPLLDATQNTLGITGLGLGIDFGTGVGGLIGRIGGALGF